MQHHHILTALLLFLALSCAAAPLGAHAAPGTQGESAFTVGAAPLAVPDAVTPFSSRSDLPVGANQLSATRCVHRLNTLRTLPGRTGRARNEARDVFARMHSPAALGLLFVALLLLPFTGRTEFH